MQLERLRHVGANAAGDDEHGHAVEERLADAAHRMRDTRGRHDAEHPDGVGCPADAVGHEGAAAFMRDEHRRDLLGTDQLVVEFDVVNARDPEGITDTDLLQRVTNERSGGGFHYLLASETAWCSHFPPKAHRTSTTRSNLRR